MKEFERINSKSSLIGQRIELASRLQGRTTRLIDKFIQEIYQHQGEWVTIEDHHPTKQAHRMLFDMIMRRMQFEHQDDEVKVDLIHGAPRIMLVKCRRDALQPEIDRLGKEIEGLRKDE